MPELLVIGASARAAAWSGRRIGPVAAIDQFDDEDTAALAEVVRSTRFPDDLVEIAAAIPRCPWVYTGGLENHPAIVGAIAAERPLLGNDADVLTDVRNPFRVATWLAARDLPVLAVRPGNDPPPRDGGWVLRPTGGCAGRGIERWTETARRPGRGDLFQRFAVGPSFSGVFVAWAEGTEFCGATRQLFRSNRPFEWSGNVGPIDLDDLARDLVERIAQSLRGEFGLRGLFGIDFVLAGGVPCPVEVNPRYTASVEILERVAGRDLMAAHVASCGTRDRPATKPSDGTGGALAKHVLYAATTIPATRAWDGTGIESDLLVADRPRPGTRIEPGSPLCTLLVPADDPDTALARVTAIAPHVAERFGGRAERIT